MPVPELILIKHSQPQIEPAKPAAEWQLSEVGRQRCEQLGELAAIHHPQALYCSLETKARQTAERIAGRLGLAVQPVEGLHEHERRSAAYTDRETFEFTMQDFFQRLDDQVFGEESARQAQQRFTAAITNLLDQNPRRTLVVVAHGTVISLYVRQYNNISLFAFWRSLGLPAMVILERPSLKIHQIVEQIE
jgi:broad specificity phosphatase PhoE